MKASDWLAAWLKERVTHVFGLQGGAVVHLFDSCHRVGPQPIYCHHEQAAALAATAYAKLHGYGACIVTTGPGGTNALTGLLAAWQDSVPCMFISGQVRAEHLSYGKPLRQVGSQEFAIVEVAKKMTKRATFVWRIGKLKNAVQDAYAVSRANRPGPVWLDVSQDVLWAQMP